MKKTSFLFLSLLSFVILFPGCNTEKPPTTPIDEEFPTITMTSPIEVPYGQFVAYNSSDSLIIDIRFDDDVELDRYSITIRYSNELNYLKTANFPWTETFFGDLSGQSGGFNHFQQVVYDPTAGPYTFNVKVWDKLGNLTEKNTYFFVTNLLDTHLPDINITVPNAIDTFHIGDNLRVRATISDPPSVVNCFMRLRNPVTLALLPGSEIRIDSIWASSYVLDTFFPVQAGSIPGDYRIEVYATDQVANVGEDTARVYILP